MQEPITLEKIMRDRPPKSEEDAKKAKELIELVEALPKSYDNLVFCAYLWARKYNRYDETIEFLKARNRTCSELVLFHDSFDDTEH